MLTAAAAAAAATDPSRARARERVVARGCARSRAPPRPRRAPSSPCQEYASRSPVEAGAVVLELLLRTPLREALPVLTALRPLARLVELWRDVQAVADPSDADPHID